MSTSDELSPANQRVEMTYNQIETQSLIEFVSSPEAGAVTLFLGTVRELTAGRRTVALDYDAYPEMAIKTMRDLVSEAVSRWPVIKVAVIHRLGHLALGETSVAVAVSCPHRKDAFHAAQFLIDELKVRVPIWKKENWADGTSEWVHPRTDC